MTWLTIKILSISALLLVPAMQAMQGMQELTLDDKSLPVELRHRGYTPLHVAISLGNRDQITHLIADGVVDARSISGSTPLHIAAEKGDVETVEALIAELQKINSFACPLNKQTIGTTSIVDIQDNSGIMPLACAAANGHRDVIGCLIAHGASICHADKRGRFSFHRATQNGHLEAMRMLLPDLQFDRAYRHGHLDPILSAARSNDDLDFRLFCWTALECAVKSGKTDVLAFVMKLIEGRLNPETGYPLEQCGNGVTPFLLAAKYGHVHLLQLLLEISENRIHQFDSKKATALHYAARFGKTDAARFVLEKDPTKINKPKNDSISTNLAGGTALHEAAYYGHNDVIKLLLSHGAELEGKEAIGWTALHLAAMQGRVSTLKLLIGLGASVTTIDNSEFTPLHKAAARGHEACIEVLLRNGADIESKAKGNRTPLHEAVEAGHLEVAKCLVNRGADINKKSALGSPLMHAIIREHVPIIEWLLSLTSTELADRSPYFVDKPAPILFIAAREGKVESIRCLLNNGLSVHKRLSDGRTILHYCRPEHDSAVFDLLMRAGADMLCPNNAGVTPLDALNLPADELTSAKQYYQNRPLYLKGQLGKDDIFDSIFAQAAHVRFDIPVLVALKDLLKDRLPLYRWRGGKNLLMIAFERNDVDGIIEVLANKICAITDVDDENHDALWFAINTKKMLLINKVLEAGAKVTEGHLLQASSFEPRKDVSEILMRLLTIYRYSERPINERISMFK